MFRSIEYKLIFYLVTLIVSVAGGAIAFFNLQVYYGILACLAVGFSISRLWHNYKKFNKNIDFLINALDNDDYSFFFSTTKLSRREKELNSMLNRIKSIIVKAKNKAIENEKFLSVVLENTPIGIIIFNESGGVRMVNDAAMRLLGLSVFTHVNQLRTIDAKLPGIFKNLTPQNKAQVKISNEREEKEISLSMSRIVLSRDKVKVVTLNSIDNELNAREMESWIKLIRVMTHEIMNSIAPITSLSDTMLFAYRENGDDGEQTELTKNSVDAFETINSTTKGLLSFVDSYRRFTGIPQPTLKEFRVVPLIEKIINLEEPNLVKCNIALDVSIDGDDLKLSADEAQITQVLLNVIKNAIEALALPTLHDKKIRIKLSETDGNIQIDICNNGDPIAEDVAQNIFVPFFTTKESGTGIGLSISRYIMRLHGGNLKYHVSDGWTIFSLVF